MSSSLPGFASLALAFGSLVSAGGARAAMVDPALDDMGREWCYLAKSTTVIGVPYMPDAVQVTFDGAIFTTQAELCFFYGAPLQPVMARQKTFLNGWIPIVGYDWQAGPIHYELEMFGAVLDGESASNTVQFARVRLTNTSTSAAPAILASAMRHSGQDCRYYEAAFPANATYAMTNGGVFRDSALIYTFPAGAEQQALPGLPYAQPFSGANAGVTARSEVGLARYQPVLAPGQSQDFVFKMPRVPVPSASAALLQKIQSADYSYYRAKTVAFWMDLFNAGAQFNIPEPRVNAAWRAGLVHLMLATRDRGGQQFQTSGLPYPNFFMIDFVDMRLAYDVTGHPDFSEQSFPQIFQRQLANGLFCDTSLSGGRELWSSHGHMVYSLSHHYLMTRDTNYVQGILPQFRAAMNWMTQARTNDATGLMPAAWPYDAEMIQGHYTSHNLWSLLGARTAIQMAQQTGLAADQNAWQQLHDAYFTSFTNALTASVGTNGYVPTGLYPFQAGPSVGFPWYNTDQDWENMLLVYPTELLQRSDWRVPATLQAIRRDRYHEGIMSYRNGMHEHQYVTGNLIEQYIQTGNPRQALVDYYHLLLHCGSTSEGFENMVEPWKDRLLTATIPPPHAWAAAKMAQITRNMLLTEYGGRAGLDAGQRDLYLFPVISPAWAVPGQELSLSNAPTEMGKVWARMQFTTTGAQVTISNQFHHPPRNLVVRVPWFVQLNAFSSDASSAVRDADGVRLTPDATTLTLNWQTLPNIHDRTWQDLLLAYRGEVSFWDGPRSNAPAPPVASLSADEDQHPPAVLSFTNVLDAFRHEYALRFTNYLAQGGQPTVIAAPAIQMAETGTVFQYGFDFSSGSVAANGGSVADDGGKAHNGAVLGGDGGTYSADLPPANQLQLATGVGSLDLSTGSITTDPTGAQSGAGVVNWTSILANGGLTLETWIKGGGNGGIILTVAGEYLLSATAGGVKFANGFAEASQFAQAAFSRTSWHHVAGVLANPALSGSSLVADLELYVDGQWAATYTGASFSSDLQRGATVGNHPLLNTLNISSPFTGTVYEPRVSFGALSPAQFTIKLPAVVTITQQPTNVTVYAGSSASFAVAATVSGAPAGGLRYQWQQNQANILNATNSSYSTPPLALGDSSQFRCLVSTADGLASAMSDTVQATVVPPPQAALQWAFTQTSGPVTVPIADVSGSGHGASNLLYTGAPSYSADMPPNTQFCAGTGSVDFTGVNAALATANSFHVASGQGIVSAAQVYAAGGLTMEVWVKNPSGSGGGPYFALNLGGMYCLGVNAAGNVGFFAGDNSADNSWTTAPVPGQWMHLAVVLSQPSSDAKSYGNVSAYLNGVLIQAASHNFTFFLTRAVSAGNHQYDNWGNYEGLVYEPRIALGALTPNQFTFRAVPPTLSVGRAPGDGLVFTWSSGTLEAADAVIGPWMAVPGATSPCTNDLSAPARFFRLRQ
jgi:hypothetical protein